MEITAWLLMSIILKFLLYASVSAVIGTGTLSLLTNDVKLLKHIDRYWSIAIWLGAFIAFAYFFVQVGAFAEEGISGMTNTIYIDMLWNSNLGNALDLQIIGLFFMWLAKTISQLVREIDQSVKVSYFFWGVFMLGGLTIARSFGVVGHTFEHGLFFQLILSLHFICVTWWVGALFPLRIACDLIEGKRLQFLMERFGKFATLVVGILIVSGATLIIVFSSGNLAFFTTDYGLLLLTKLFLVSAILMIALYHKLRLVPSLASNNNTHSRLKRSITREIVLAYFILFVTAMLTTAVGTST